MNFMDRMRKQTGATSAAPVASPTPTTATAAPTATTAKTRKAATPAPKPQPDPVEVEVEEPTVETTAEVMTTNDADSNFALSLFGGSDDEAHVLNALVAQSEESSSFSPGGPFPFIKQSGGKGGGILAADKSTAPEIAELLPQGKLPFTAVFIGHRLVGSIWPESYKEGVKAKPTASFVVGSKDGDLAALVMKAGRAHQYTKKAQRDAKFAGIGQPSVAVEMLFYRRGLVFVVSTPAQYNAADDTLKSLAAALPGGRYTQFPAKVTPHTEQQEGANAWDSHSLLLSLATDNAATAVYAEFKEFAKEAANDAEFKAAFEAWKSSEVTDDVVSALTAIAAKG